MALVLILLLAAIVVLIVIGAAVLGLVLELLWWALIGLAIGALARLLVPGRQAIGLLATALLGVAGSLLGGVIANALDVGDVLQFLIAVGVAAVLVAIYAAWRREDPPPAGRGELRPR